MPEGCATENHHGANASQLTSRRLVPSELSTESAYASSVVKQLANRRYDAAYAMDATQIILAPTAHVIERARVTYRSRSRGRDAPFPCAATGLSKAIRRMARSSGQGLVTSRS
jgi:hypothetical protein